MGWKGEVASLIPFFLGYHVYPTPHEGFLTGAVLGREAESIHAERVEASARRSQAALRVHHVTAGARAHTHAHKHADRAHTRPDNQQEAISQNSLTW